MDKEKQMYNDLIEIFDEEYGKRNLITPQNTAEKLTAKGYRKIPDNIGEFSDGYHTFNELYHHRAILFSVICNSMPDKAWKSKLHDTGDMYDGMFIVGIETPEGQATYHYDIEPYWDMFKVKELEKAPKWDGHTPQVAIDRIAKLNFGVIRLWENLLKAEAQEVPIKAERIRVAREIFEEIEKALDNSVETEHFKGTWFNFSKFKQMLAELKKKYTESEDFIPAPPHTCQVEIPKYYESIINRVFPESESKK